MQFPNVEGIRKMHITHVWLSLCRYTPLPMNQANNKHFTFLFRPQRPSQVRPCPRLRHWGWWHMLSETRITAQSTTSQEVSVPEVGPDRAVDSQTRFITASKSGHLGSIPRAPSVGGARNDPGPHAGHPSLTGIAPKRACDRVNLGLNAAKTTGQPQFADNQEWAPSRAGWRKSHSK